MQERAQPLEAQLVPSWFQRWGSPLQPDPKGKGRENPLQLDPKRGSPLQLGPKGRGAPCILSQDKENPLSQVPGRSYLQSLSE